MHKGFTISTMKLTEEKEKNGGRQQLKMQLLKSCLPKLSYSGGWRWKDFAKDITEKVDFERRYLK